MQTTWYDALSQSFRIPALKTAGWGWALSGEGGYPYLIHGLLIEPQAQLIYQDINLRDTHDIAASIRFRDEDSLRRRLGVRLARQWNLSESTKEKILTTWFRPNIWHEFKGNPKAQFSSAYGYIPFTSELEGTSLELNLGTTLALPKKVSLYANGSYSLGLNIPGYSYDGRLGIKMKLT